MRRIFIVTFLLLSSVMLVNAQQTIPLYNGQIPNCVPTANVEYANEQHVFFKVSQPALSIYLPSPERANGTAVIICPGGGYSALWMKNEGWDVAEKMNKLGVAAFVLKYRLPDSKTMEDKSIGPLQDAQQAIKIVRQRAAEWKIDSHKIGIMGFSAGGHLASTAGTHFNKSRIENSEGINLRPDFMILVYPVISFNDSLTHSGSKEALIGKNPSQENVRLFSSELQVTQQTPPTFLIHAQDDKLVTINNSIRFYESLLHFSIPADLHIFPTGEHGFPFEPAHSNWFGYCIGWMQKNGWIDNKTPILKK